MVCSIYAAHVSISLMARRHSFNAMIFERLSVFFAEGRLSCCCLMISVPGPSKGPVSQSVGFISPVTFIHAAGFIWHVI
jgi:hypothetical protein